MRKRQTEVAMALELVISSWSKNKQLHHVLYAIRLLPKRTKLSEGKG